MANILFIILLGSTLHQSSAVDVDQSAFISQLLQLANDHLGINKFQQFIDDPRNTKIGFNSSIPDGMSMAEKISSGIEGMVQSFTAAVRAIQTAYSYGQPINQIQTDLCCNLPNLVDNPSFKRPIDATTVCHSTQSAMNINVGVKNAMMDNFQRIPQARWQYYGTEDGLHAIYPSSDMCEQSLVYDPRVRPWYTGTVNRPRDIIILVDRSNSMADSYSSTQSATKLSVARNAASAIVKYLNPNDRVAVLAFSNTILSVDASSCFAKELAVANSANVQKLLDFLQSGLFVADDGARSSFTNAFRTAGQVYEASYTNTSTVLFADREKSILMLTTGNQLEDCQSIRALNNQLFNNTVNIFIMEISGNPTDQTACLRNLTAGPRGAHGFVPYDDIVNLRSQLGFYYNAFVDEIDRINVTFSVPYTDVNGLGLVMSICLPLFLLDQTIGGVTCIDFEVGDVLNDIVNFHLGKLSYGFVIDSQGRVLLHPLLPQPRNWQDQPTLLELTKVEISTYSFEIEKKILSGLPGSQSVSIKCFAPIGQSDLQGVTKFETTATYFWHPIPTMKFFMCLVIVQNELDFDLTWNFSIPSVFLADELDLSLNGKCVFYDRLTLTANKTVVKLAPVAFETPANYADRNLTNDDVSQLKAFIAGKGAQPQNLALKNGLRDMVSISSFLETVWLSAPVDTQRQQHVLSRYMGTMEGVFRRFPVVRIAKDFNPASQSWYKSAVCQAGQTSLTLPFLDIASRVPLISLSQTLFNRSRSAQQIIGVMGMDVTVKYIFNLISSIDQCKKTGQSCFVIDRSGFVVIHENFLSTIPNGSLHITALEKVIASQLIEANILTSDTCVNYASLPLTRQLFWKVDVIVSSCQQLRSCTICKIQSSDISTNLFLIVKMPLINSGGDSCVCQNQTNRVMPCAYNRSSPGVNCQCPCSLSVDYDSCLANLNVDPATWKPCIPSGVPLTPTDVTNEERQFFPLLQSCLPCTSFRERQLCEVNNCCWLSSLSFCNQTCIGDTTTIGGNVMTSTSPASDSVAYMNPTGPNTVGLAVGLSVSLGVVCLVVVAVVLYCWCRRRSRAQPQIKTYNGIYESGGDSAGGGSRGEGGGGGGGKAGAYITTIVVTDDQTQEMNNIIAASNSDNKNLSSPHGQHAFMPRSSSVV